MAAQLDLIVMSALEHQHLISMGNVLSCKAVLRFEGRSKYKLNLKSVFIPFRLTRAP